MNKNLSISLFGMFTKAIFLFFTTLTLLLYSACSSDEPTETPTPTPTPTPEPPQTYTVTFNTNGGTEVQSEEVNSGDTVARPEAPTKTDSVFANWFTDEALTNIYSFSTLVTSDLTLYAKWISEDATIYQVVFNTNGGNNVETQPIVEGETANKPNDPTRDGYRFLNWYSDPNAPSVAYDFNNTAVTDDITLYANWIKTYTVTFNTNGGTEVQSAEVNSGDTVAKPEAPTKTDSVFVNWFTDEALTSIYTFSTLVTSDLTLYAKWISEDATTYQVTFNTNGGNSNVETQPIVEGKTANKPDDPTRDGYKFLNWYSDPNAPSVAYNFTETAVTDDITLYVNWLKRFTVTFNMNGGTALGTQTQTIDSGKVVAKPTDLRNAEHGGTFEGWYSNRELTAEHENDTVKSNLTLYAKWEYMVTYDKSTREVTGLAPNLMGSDVHLVIPSNINGLMMESIRNDAFKRNTRIVSLSIAEGIKYIGDSAFDGYDRSTFTDISRIEGNLVIPNSVVTIGNSAFYRCSRLSGNLTIPNSVVTIGNSAFYRCSGLSGNLTIPNSVETIGDYAFLGCEGFGDNLTIGNSVVTIGQQAFGDCTGFTASLTIPISVKTIGLRAFIGIPENIDTFIFEPSDPPSMLAPFGAFWFLLYPDLVIIVPNAEVVEAYATALGASDANRNKIKVAE